MARIATSSLMDNYKSSLKKESPEYLQELEIFTHNEITKWHTLKEYTHPLCDYVSEEERDAAFTVDVMQHAPHALRLSREDMLVGQLLIEQLRTNGEVSDFFADFLINDIAHHISIAAKQASDQWKKESELQVTKNPPDDMLSKGHQNQAAHTPSVPPPSSISWTEKLGIRTGMGGRGTGKNDDI